MVITTRDAESAAFALKLRNPRKAVRHYEAVGQYRSGPAPLARYLGEINFVELLEAAARRARDVPAAVAIARHARLRVVNCALLFFMTVSCGVPREPRNSAWLGCASAMRWRIHSDRAGVVSCSA